MYHVINRGNYRHDVFGSVGAAQAFEQVLAESSERYGWKVHAYVVMRNHFHLALSTPGANLVEGMHWLQGTFATRFNRLRDERGHLFQGRYHALLIEDSASLARVADYIHLNPVRAKIVPVEQIAAFRWSSLRRFRSPTRPKHLACEPWLQALSLEDTFEGWQDYEQHLVALSTDHAEQERQGFAGMSRGWAIGTLGWKRAIAKDHAHLALAPGVSGEELQEMKRARWTAELDEVLRKLGKTAADAEREGRFASWKIEVAQRLRLCGASCGWISSALNMGTPGSLRVYLCRARSAS